MFIAGNHDRKYAFNLLDVIVEELESELGGVKIHYYRDDDYYVVDRILLLHGITRSGGSDYTGITPLIQNNIIPLAIENNTDIVVLGHYHRSVLVQYMGRIIIALPSFQYANKPLRNERGMVLLRERDTIKLVRTKPCKRAELIEYWRRAVKI